MQEAWRMLSLLSTRGLGRARNCLRTMRHGIAVAARHDGCLHCIEEHAQDDYE